MGGGEDLNQNKLDDATRFSNVDYLSILHCKVGIQNYRTEKQAKLSALFLMSKEKF